MNSYKENSNILFCLQTGNFVSGAMQSVRLFLKYSQLPKERIFIALPCIGTNAKAAIEEMKNDRITCLIMNKEIDHESFERWAFDPLLVIKKVLNRASYCARLAFELRNKKISCAVINGIRGNTDDIVCKMLGVKNIWYVRGLEGWIGKSEHKISFVWIKRLRLLSHYLLSDAIITVNKRQKQLLLSYFKLKKTIVTISNGVDPNEIKRAKEWHLSKNSDKKENKLSIATTMSTICPMKGILEYIKVVEEMNNKYQNIEFSLYGNIRDQAPESQCFLSKLHELINNQKVFYHGYVKNVAQILSTADIFFYPSWSEGSPRSILDAMLAKLAIVASKIEGIDEQIEDGKTGLLFESRNIEQMMIQLDRVILDTGLRANLGENAFNKLCLVFNGEVVATNIDKIIHQTCSTYEEAI